ncbi:MAG: thioredoxin domain-containing protein [Candidatus Margulisiibacteriota bacterium]
MLGNKARPLAIAASLLAASGYGLVDSPHRSSQVELFIAERDILHNQILKLFGTLCDDKDPANRARVADEIGEKGNKSGFSSAAALLGERLLKDESPAVRLRIAEIFGKYGQIDEAKYLTRSLKTEKDPSVKTRVETARNKIRKDHQLNDLMPEIATIRELDALRENPNNIIVVSFSADWCSPCKIFEPKLLKLAAKYKGQIIFVKVDVTEGDAYDELFERFLGKDQTIPAIFIIKGDAEKRLSASTDLIEKEIEMISRH